MVAASNGDGKMARLLVKHRADIMPGGFPVSTWLICLLPYTRTDSRFAACKHLVCSHCCAHTVAVLLGISMRAKSSVRLTQYLCR